MNSPKTLLLLSMSALFALGSSACSGCGDDPPPTTAPRQDAGVDMSTADMPTSPDLGEEDMGMTPDEDMPADMADAPDMSDMGADMAPEDMTPDMADWPTEVIGRVNITYWREDALYDYPELHVHALFSKEIIEANVVDPVGWLAATDGVDVFSFDDFWAFPEPGDAGVDADIPVEIEATPTYKHAGDFVVLGEELVANLRADLLEENPELYVYELSVEDAAEAAAEVSLEDPLSLLIEGGDDIQGWKSDPVISVPETWDVTGPDPDQFLALYGQKELEVTWTPTATEDDILLLTVETSSLARAFQIDDSGQLDLDALLDREQLVFQDQNAISLARIMRHQIPTPSGVVEVDATRKFWLYGQKQAPYSITPDTFPVGQTVEAEMVWRPGDFGATPQIDLGANVTVENIQVIGSERQIARFDVVVEPGAEIGRRALEVTGDGNTQATLPGFAWIVDALPSAGICSDAVDEGFVPDGAYVASDGGLESDLFSTSACPEGSADGREQVIPLQMQAGQTLRAWARNSEAPSTLYVVGDCADVDGAFACSVAPRRARSAELRYTAYQDEQILLVVDNQAGGLEPSEYLVEIERSAPAAFAIFPERLVAGVSTTLEIDSFLGNFDTDQTLFDFGPDVTIESVFIEDAYAEIVVRLADDAAPGPIAASASIAGQAYNVADAIEGVGYANGPASCAEADTQGPLGAGTYEGLTFTGSDGLVSPQPCLSTDALGQEAILRVDLEPSQTLRARVRMITQDPVIYLLDDCSGVAQVCADDTGPNRSEYLEWTAPEAPTTVYLVVDGYDIGDSDVFSLELDLIP